MKVLVVNCGSSSLKFQLIETSPEQIGSDTDRRLARGVIERIGGQALLEFRNGEDPPEKSVAPIRDHRQAIEHAVHWCQNVSEVAAVGHRVVHGGERFQSSVRITPEVIAGIEDCVRLAPLHNPANLRGISAVTALLGPDLPQVAVFDTAFHATMPPTAYLYGIPYNLYRRHKIRRYGFHGTSHRYVAYRYRQWMGVPKERVNIISLHLGSGCSACAIQAGRSVNTSMGMTPLEGLLMGTRAGDLDPSIFEVLMQEEGLNAFEVDTLLNKQSGLLGVSGLTGDMRDLLLERDETNDRRASLAVEMFCARVRHYVGAYLADMDGADGIVFTGGIGQNSPQVRSQIARGLSWFGVQLDENTNNATVGDQGGCISLAGTRLPVYVLPTDEELLIARDTVRATLT